MMNESLKEKMVKNGMDNTDNAESLFNWEGKVKVI